MRIAIGEFAHETNTFCPGFTELDAFKSTFWCEGDEIFTVNRGVRNDLGGMIEAGERLGIELAPMPRDHDPAFGDGFPARVRNNSRHPVRVIWTRLVRSMRSAWRCTEQVRPTVSRTWKARFWPSCAGRSVREIPIFVSLDLHGNTTDAMLEHTTGAFYCHEYPHIDTFDRGAEIVEMAYRFLKGEVKPTNYLLKLPLIIPPSTTFSGPAKAINERCFEWEAKPGVIDCSFTHGFPHTDVSVVCTSVLVTTDNDPELARTVAEDVAALIVASLDQFHQPLPGADEAIIQALAATELPVVVAEVSDNPGGGAPGNGTHLLRALLAANEPQTCFGFIWDPQTALQAHAAGPGSTIEVTLGGFTDELHGAPIVASAYVKSVTDGRFVLVNPMGAGSTVDLGKMARLVIGNVDVIVGSNRAQTLDAQLFLLHGIDVREMRIVAIKSQQHFRGGFKDIAGTIIRCDTPGLTTSELAHLPFQHIKRPIWPLDPLPAISWATSS